MSYEQAMSRYRDCGLRKRDVNAFKSRRPGAKMLRKQTSATIQVNYSNDFPSEARAAFERAADIWERHISSSVPIVIAANWESLGARVLGSAGPLLALVDADDDGSTDTFRGLPLHDAVTGRNQFETQVDVDIVAQFNSDRNDWHFGQEPAPAETIDFTSIVLHEIGHGLNYTSVLNYDTGSGGYGFDIDGNGQIDENERVPGPFARRIDERQTDGTLLSLVNEREFPNPSVKLGGALTSDQLFFTGNRSEEAAGQGNGPPRPKMYAPDGYDQGSSIAHLDEDTYPFESANALMTPFAEQAETNRLPGPIVCGQLLDMGWPLGTGCEKYFQTLFAVSVQDANGQGGSRTLSWSERSNADIQEYIVDRRYFDGGFEEVKRVDASEVTGSTLTVEDLGLGAFTFRLRWVEGDGTEETSPERVRDTITVGEVGTTITDRDEQERGTVDVSWTVPPGTSSDFVYRVERREGEEGAFRPVGTVPQESDAGDEQTKQYTAERQTPGRYEYRVRAQDESGNAVTSTSRAVEIGFEGDVYALGPYPNPVRETASFDLTARESQSVTVEVYNTIGERVYRDQREVRAQDPSFLSIDASQWASGVYFLRLRGDGSVGQTKKMIVVQ